MGCCEDRVSACFNVVSKGDWVCTLLKKKFNGYFNISLQLTKFEREQLMLFAYDMFAILGIFAMPFHSMMFLSFWA